ncbi:stefin-C-like [Hypanus sabinus]|uniref:stefin-C-like n=1 Tax=Hypanus sabinus TaxID=79690 RepID=UPI0028C42E48|nr:stefin-C-like [Hypanus sabinus]
MALVWTGEQTATSNVQKIANAVKSDVENHISHTVVTYIAKKYREQDQSAILGKFYLIKIDIDTNNFVHVEVFVPNNYPGSQPVLLSVVENIKMSDPLDPLV